MLFFIPQEHLQCLPYFLCRGSQPIESRQCFNDVYVCARAKQEPVGNFSSVVIGMYTYVRSRFYLTQSKLDSQREIVEDLEDYLSARA